MSMNYNRVTLVGRLTKDVEVKETENSIRASFSLAIDRPYKKEDGSKDTDFISVVFWGKMGKLAGQYLKKGSPVLVEGRIQVRSFEHEDTRRYVSEIVGEQFIALSYASRNTDSSAKSVTNQQPESVEK